MSQNSTDSGGGFSGMLFQPSSRPAAIVTASQRKVMRWMQGLEAFRGIDPTMPTQLVYTFLTVATHEGISATEIAEASGFKLSTVSRHLLDLGRRNRMKGLGYDLVEPHVDEEDIRRKFYTLTPKGKQAFHLIEKVMSM